MTRKPRKPPRIGATVAVAGLEAHPAGDRVVGGQTRGGVAGEVGKGKLAATISCGGILEMMEKTKNPHAVALGRAGGLARRAPHGLSVLSPEHRRAISAAGVAARRANAAKRAAENVSTPLKT